MKARVSLGVFLTSAFLVSILAAATPLAASAQSVPVPGCFHFTLNGAVVGPQYCTVKANDIAMIFVTGPNCYFNTGTLAMACPKGANNIDVTWGRAATGAPALLTCDWTKGKMVISSCPVMTGSDSFTVHAQSITKVFWTLNGKKLGNAIVSPTPANDLEFSLIETAT
ncbi:MAG TPA: hypothetical protein VED17_04615 [Nitrososphaerales archaeon]|nr:hypothetical protein [Nitrososphaerales archaeon]